MASSDPMGSVLMACPSSHGVKAVVPHGMSQSPTPSQLLNYVLASSTCAASAAEAAAQRKELKYSEISSSHHFFPLAIETLGPINAEGQRFVSELGHRITAVTDDPQKTSFLFHRLSVTIQRYNAVSLATSF